MIKKEQYKLELYKPTGEYAGLLDVFNLNTTLSIEGYSTISFNIAAYTGAEENMRLFEVLDLYEVVLTIRDKKYRFVLKSIPTSFDDGGPRYTYEGLSVESELDKKFINGWIGAERNISFYQKTFKAKGTYPSIGGSFNHVSFSIPLPLHLNGMSMEKISEYIEVVEMRESPDIFRKASLVYQPTTSGTFFKRGTYNIQLSSGNLQFTIAKYEKEDLFGTDNSELMSRALGIYYHVYLNPPIEVTEEGEAGLLLISDAIENIEYAPLEEYIEGNNSIQYYTTSGVTIEEILDNNLVEKTEWTYNILGASAAEISNIRRSDFEFNNISIYQILEDIKKTFDVVYIIDSDSRHIDFYKSFEEYDPMVTNNIILGEGAYLKSIEKTLDTNEVATNIYGVGKDYITTAMFSPTVSWFDYSYYLDDYWRSAETISDIDILRHFINGELRVVNHSKLDSKWMNFEMAHKVAQWQRTRDVIVKLFFNEDNVELPTDVDTSLLRYKLLNKARNIIAERDEALEELGRLETKYIEYKALKDNYNALAEYSDRKRNDSNDEHSNTVQQSNIDYVRYSELSQNILNTEALKTQIDNLEKRLFDLELSDLSGVKNFGYIFTQIQKELEKFLLVELGVDLKQLDKFRFDYILQDDKVIRQGDLLEKVREYAAKNAKPKVTLNVDIIDILAAHDIPEEDKNNLFVGNYLYVNFPMFNIDEKAQIKSMNIDFDSNSISLEISTVERYSTGLLQKMVKNIRALGGNYKNIDKYKQDENKRFKNIAKRTQNTIDGGIVNEVDITNDDQTIAFNNFGINLDGAEIDYDNDGFKQVTREDRINIGSGEVFLEKVYETKDENDNIVNKKGTQVIMSLDDGFVINKVDWTGGSFDKKELTKMFQTNEKGDLYLHGGLMVGRNTPYEDKLIVNPTFDDVNGVYIGPGIVADNAAENENEDPSGETWYLRQRPVISARGTNGHFLWDGRNLDMSGTIRAKRGNIGGWKIRSNRLYSEIGENYVGIHTPHFSQSNQWEDIVAFTAGKIDLLGDPSWDNVKFGVTFDGRMKATDAFIEGEIVATKGRIGSLTIDEDIASKDELGTETIKLQKTIVGEKYFYYTNTGTLTTNADYTFENSNLTSCSSGSTNSINFLNSFYSASSYPVGTKIKIREIYQDWLGGGICPITYMFEVRSNTTIQTVNINIREDLILERDSVGNISFTVKNPDLELDSNDIIEVTNILNSGKNAAEKINTDLLNMGVNLGSQQIAGWHIRPNRFESASTGDYYVGLDSGESQSANTGGYYRIWAGHNTPSLAPFSITDTGFLSATEGRIGDLEIAKINDGGIINFSAVDDPIGIRFNQGGRKTFFEYRSINFERYSLANSTYNGSKMNDEGFYLHRSTKSFSDTLEFGGSFSNIVPNLGIELITDGGSIYSSGNLEIKADQSKRVRVGRPFGNQDNSGWGVDIVGSAGGINLETRTGDINIKTTAGGSVNINGSPFEINGTGTSVINASNKLILGTDAYPPNDESLGIHVRRRNSSDNGWETDLLRNPNGTGAVSTSARYSTEVIKKNIKEIPKEDFYEFLDKVEVFSYEHKGDSIPQVSLIIEREIEKKNKFSDILFHQREGNGTHFSSIEAVPEWLLEYLDTDVLYKKDEGYFFNPKTYDDHSMTGVVLGALKTLHNRVKELEDKLNN